MDDETYVKGDSQQLPICQFYVQKTGTTLNLKYKIIKMDKFPKITWFGKLSVAEARAVPLSLLLQL